MLTARKQPSLMGHHGLGDPYVQGTDFQCTSDGSECYGIGTMDAKVRNLQTLINRGLLPSTGLISVDGKFGQDSLDGFMSIADYANGLSDSTASALGASLQIDYGGAATNFLQAVQSIFSNIDDATSNLQQLDDYENWQAATVAVPTSQGGSSVHAKPPPPPFISKKPSTTSWLYYAAGGVGIAGALGFIYLLATRQPGKKRK